MIKRVRAISPMGEIKLFFTFFYFIIISFFYKYRTPPPPYFVWRFRIDIVKLFYFIWNNIVSSKNKKEETTYILNPFKYLAVRRSTV